MTQIFFYTGKLLLIDAFTHRSFYTEQLLQREVFAKRSPYTEESLHRRAFTQRSLYTDQLLHTEAKALTQGSHLYAGACTRKRIYTQKLLHREAFTQSILATEDICDVSKIAILPFGVRPSFRAKGLHLVFQNWNFTQFFAVRPSCRAKGLDLIFQKWNFRQFFFVSTFQFDVVKLRTSFCRLTFIACERVASGFSKLQFCTTFCGPTWFDLHFVRKGDAAPENIRISLRVCASDTHDLRRGLTPK